MSVLGSCFALGIVFLICLVYFRNKYFLTRASKYYIVCLLLTLVSALVNIVKIYVERSGYSPSLVCTVSTVNLILIMLTVSINRVAV